MHHLFPSPKFVANIVDITLKTLYPLIWFFSLFACWILVIIFMTSSIRTLLLFIVSSTVEWFIVNSKNVFFLESSSPFKMLNFLDCLVKSIHYDLTAIFDKHFQWWRRFININCKHLTSSFWRKDGFQLWIRGIYFVHYNALVFNPWRHFINLFVTDCITCRKCLTTHVPKFNEVHVKLKTHL